LDLPYKTALDLGKAKMAIHCEEETTSHSELLAEEPKEMVYPSIDLGDLDDKPTVEEALNGPEAEKWDEGIWDQLQSLREVEVYRLIPQEDIPKGRKILGNKIVLGVPEGHERRKIRSLLFSSPILENYTT